MIKSKHHFFIYPFFQRYTKRTLRKNFHKVEIVGEFQENHLPVLVLANHISWWDGFWVMHLNLEILHRKFHFMMLEEQLKKHWYFRYAGGFSVRRNTLSIIKTLNYTTEILQNKHNMVLLFPQGHLRSMHEKELTFESGIGKIVKGCKNEINILFAANFIEYGSKRKPSLFMHIQSYKGEGKTTTDIQNGYNDFYRDALSYQINNAER